MQRKTSWTTAFEQHESDKKKQNRIIEMRHLFIESSNSLIWLCNVCTILVTVQWNVKSVIRNTSITHNVHKFECVHVCEYVYVRVALVLSLAW